MFEYHSGEGQTVVMGVVFTFVFIAYFMLQGESTLSLPRGSGGVVPT